MGLHSKGLNEGQLFLRQAFAFFGSDSVGVRGLSHTELMLFVGDIDRHPLGGDDACGMLYVRQRRLA